jgi:hypothetical protein
MPTLSTVVAPFDILLKHVYDNTGSLYSVANAVGNNTLFDPALYDNYSPA